MLSEDYVSGGRSGGGGFIEDEEPTQPRSTFFGLTRGVSRFGILAGGSLAVTLLFRLVEPLAPVGWLLLGCGLAGSALTITFTRSDRLKFNVSIVTLLLMFGVLCGTWDAVRALFLYTPFAGQILTVVLIFGAVVGIDLLRRQQSHGK